ncbi:hypothetical protein PMKS-001229 [Pichia membranifaciens]|uniref:COP9 signalosome complex subunit 5 n=1 Tax=Pichia membranifaciens TaxID=4926 RepID=A0A1Q2YE34_9ASCO|nr:hypothetical protein PMKS-001229 [Pichia membranifaciens]
MKESHPCCSGCDDDKPLENASFALLGFLNGAVDSGLSKLKKMTEGRTVNIDSPPDVTRRVLEADGNTNNDFYTYPNEKNDNSADRDFTNKALWKKHPYYFRTVNISLLTMLKMSAHAVSGGSIEIMGMLVGYYKGNELIVLDCYPLPVQGTESRVNPQSDSYEFMLSFLTKLQESGIRKENIIGWYHSHPGFGCWLSGIDVQTQKLHQGFEDPYVAIVVDPIKSLKSGMVDIGAFRTLYDEHLRLENINTNNSNAELGWHGKDYYALNVKVFINEYDRVLLEKFNRVGSFNSLVVGGKDYNNDDENIATKKNAEVNQRDYDALKLWKKFSKVLDQASLDNTNTKAVNEELLESSISTDSVDTDAKFTSTKMSGNPDFGRTVWAHKQTNLGENMNMTSTEAETAGGLLTAADESRLELERLGVEMDLVSAEEVKQFLVKNIQRGLFE